MQQVQPPIRYGGHLQKPSVHWGQFLLLSQLPLLLQMNSLSCPVQFALLVQTAPLVPQLSGFGHVALGARFGCAPPAHASMLAWASL
jgi:hypothetical protein